VRDPITAPVETTPNAAAGATAPAPVPPGVPVVTPDAGTVDAGTAADAGG